MSFGWNKERDEIEETIRKHNTHSIYGNEPWLSMRARRQMNRAAKAV
jgi:hypothetical protein